MSSTLKWLSGGERRERGTGGEGRGREESERREAWEGGKDIDVSE